jgi:hypothetical protein
MKTCTWIGNGERCTHTVVDGRSYCEDHLWRVYQKGTHLSKRKKDMRIAASVFLIESLFNEAVEELIEEGELEDHVLDI